MTNRRFGWKRDLPDPRDRAFRFTLPPIPTRLSAPSSIDLRRDDSPIYDQSTLGSCTAQAIGGMMQFVRRKNNLLPDALPSALFLYYNERDLEGTIESDAGASIRNGIKCVAKLGDCAESMWPYDIVHFRDQPTIECYLQASNYTALMYQSLPLDGETLKYCLSLGFPFVFGFSVFPSFFSQITTETGTVFLPAQDEKVIGGHAVMCVGYDDTMQHAIVRNSWGTNWGNHGYCYMPYAYFTSDRVADLWVITTLSA